MHLVHLLFAEASSEMVLLECWVSLRKGNAEKRLSYAKSHKKWFENQWEQFLWRDESKFVYFGLNHQHGESHGLGAAFQSAVFGILSKLMKLRKKKSTVRFGSLHHAVTS